MRTMLFFDLPTLTKKNQRDYRVFVKELEKLGFYRIQESVFVKTSIDDHVAEVINKKIQKIVPKSGCVFAITITEKQFASMKLFIGEIATDVETSTNRIIEI